MNQSFNNILTLWSQLISIATVASVFLYFQIHCWFYFRLRLPSNLFKFRIELKSLKAWNEFIEYLRSYNTRTGSFFNSNFMHELLLISQLLVDDKFIEIFISHKELLKSIPIISYSHYDKLAVKWTFNDAVVIKRVRLLDTVIITNLNLINNLT